MTVQELRNVRCLHKSGIASGSRTAHFSTFVTAALFLSLPTMLDVLNVSLFGTSARPAYSIL